MNHNQIKPLDLVSISGEKYVVVAIHYDSKSALLKSINKDYYIFSYPKVSYGLLSKITDEVIPIFNWANQAVKIVMEENYLPPLPHEDWDDATFVFYEILCSYIKGVTLSGQKL